MNTETTAQLDLKVSTMLFCVVYRLLERERLLEEWEVEYLTGLSQETLRKARLRWERGQGGIQFIRFEGGDIRYRREHVEAFLAAREVKPVKRRKEVSTLGCKVCGATNK